MLKGDFPTVLLSIETASRELESKLLLASALASKGLRVIIGHKEIITSIAEQSEHVLWLGKSLFSVKGGNHLADNLIKNGSLIMFFSDEGAMHQANIWEAQTIHKHWIDYFKDRTVHRICLWGRRQGDVIAQNEPKLKDQLTVTGNPRFDICLPKYSWSSESGLVPGILMDRPYFLACTRFGSVANAKGLHFPFESKLNPNVWPLSLDPLTVNDMWFTKWRQDAHDLAEFMILIKEVAHNHPDHIVVVRPHPSENHLLYQHALSSIQNIIVNRDGNVLNWIRSADLIMHTNCTTGVEAVLAERPVINFRPLNPDKSRHDVEIAVEAGISASSIPEALYRIKDILDGKKFPQIWSNHAQSMLNNLSMESIPLLVNETLGVLSKNSLDSSRVIMPMFSRFRYVLRNFLNRSRSQDYVQNKRGKFSAQHVERIVAGCQTHGHFACRIQDMTSTHVIVEPALSRTR